MSISSPVENASNNEVDCPSSQVIVFDEGQPLALDSGTTISPFQIAYQTPGQAQL